MIMKYIIGCKTQIMSLLDRVRGKHITHIIVTTNGEKIKCYDSVELYDGEENKIIVAACQVGFKDKLMTIKDQNINYMTENFNEDAWNEILHLSIATEDKKPEENRLYI